MLEAHDLDWSLWSDLFPHCTHIFLTRRNKVRQAVSWWKAIQDEQWHFKRGDSTKRDADFYHEKYVFDALLHLFNECNMREAMTESFFAHNHIKPYTIVYEDMIRDYEYTLQDLLAEIGVKDKCVIEKKPFQKTANQINEQWVQQFRTDLQKGWKRIMW
jgi:LPS sulfotransferase NodH